MGMFYDRLMESAPADIIQDPDEVGVDLDAVEQAVAGEDGIEAHRDEIEDAVEGVIGDPVEEACMIMYESNHNFNEIMKCIGMKELSEASNGRDFFMEAGSTNVKAFFGRIRAAIQSAWESITRLFHNVYVKLNSMVRTDKAFATKYANDIRKGAAMSDLKKVRCAKIGKIDYDASMKFDLLEKYNAEKNGSGTTPTKVEIANAELKKFGITITDYDTLREKFESHMINTEDSDYAPSVDEVITILKGDKETKAIKETYGKIKDTYKKTLSDIKKIEDGYFRKGMKDGNTYDKEFGLITKYLNLMKDQKNIQHVIYAVCMSAAKRKRADARRLARIWYRAGAKRVNPKKKDEDVEVQHNSTFFANII